MIQLKLQGICPTSEERRRESNIVRRFLHDWNKLFFEYGWFAMRKNGNHAQQVVPKQLQRLGYRELHENMGHVGCERVLYLVGDRFFWPFLGQDIPKFCSTAMSLRETEASISCARNVASYRESCTVRFGIN